MVDQYKDNINYRKIWYSEWSIFDDAIFALQCDLFTLTVCERGGVSVHGAELTQLIRQRSHQC